MRCGVPGTCRTYSPGRSSTTTSTGTPSAAASATRSRPGVAANHISSPAACCVSSAGVPSAASRPPAMIATRSQRCSASSIPCVVSSTVVPRAARSRTSSHVVARACGSMPGGRLVEEHDLGLADQRARERQPLRLPARQPAHRRALGVAQPDDVEQSLGRFGIVVVRGEQAQQLERPQARVQPAVLEHHADPRAELRAVAHAGRGRARAPCRRPGVR